MKVNGDDAPVYPHICGGCGRRWSGHAECHCSACHQHFSSVATFDKHVTSAGHVQPGGLRGKDGKPVLMPVQRKSGVVWVGYYEGQHPLARKRAA